MERLQEKYVKDSPGKLFSFKDILYLGWEGMNWGKKSNTKK